MTAPTATASQSSLSARACGLSARSPCTAVCWAMTASRAAEGEMSKIIYSDSAILAAKKKIYTPFWPIFWERRCGGRRRAATPGASTARREQKLYAPGAGDCDEKVERGCRGRV